MTVDGENVTCLTSKSPFLSWCFIYLLELADSRGLAGKIWDQW